MAENGKLTDEDVLDLRRRARSLGRPFTRQNAERLGVSASRVEAAVLGLSFAHLDHIEPPFSSMLNKGDMKDQVRALYLQGKSYREICGILPVAKSSVSLYCRDIVRKNDKVETPELIEKIRSLYLSRKTASEIIKELDIPKRWLWKHTSDLVEAKRNIQAHHRGALHRDNKKRINRSVSGKQVLTDAQVIQARQETKADGLKNWNVKAKAYGVRPSTFSSAVLGLTFKHLNNQEAPADLSMLKGCLRGRIAKPGSVPKKRNPRRSLPKEIMEEALRLRRSDPVKWTYGNIGKWLSEKTGRNYTPGPTSQLLIGYDPTIKALENKQVKRVLTNAEKIRNNLAAKKKRQEQAESLRIFTENENRREKGMAELTPEERDLFLRKTTKRS